MNTLSSDLNREEIIRKAGELAVKYKKMGYHCSESVIRAVPEALGISLPSDVVRCGCGFMGGGGGTLGRCGVVEVGIMLISWLYGRIYPLQSEQNMKVLVPALIHAYENEMGSIQCSEIKFPEVEKYGPVIGCEHIYRRGASVVARVLLDADRILSGAEE